MVMVSIGLQIDNVSKRYVHRVKGEIYAARDVRLDVRPRVALARAIVIEPGVLLFDEPLSNLDAKLRVQMRHEIRDLQRRLSITTIYVTHDQEEAMAVSDRIAVMNQGSVVQEGTAEDLYHRPATEFVAQFVGRVNLIAGVVQSMNGKSATIAALGRAVIARTGSSDLAAGDPVRIA